MGKYYCTLGRIYVKQNISKQVCLKWSKNSRRVYRVGSSETPGRICNFYPCFQKGYPELKLQHNCFITNIGFPTYHIYPSSKYERKGTSKIPISQLFSELGDIWKYIQS